MSVEVWLSAGGLLVALAATALSRIAVVPRRKLRVSAVACSRLLGSEARHEHLRVQLLDRVLTDPYLAVFELRNVGRLAISSDHYDRGRPIALDLGAQVCEVLRADGPRGELRTGIDGSRIHIGPDLLGRRERAEVHVLVDGAPHLDTQPVREYLTDTSVEYVAPGKEPRARRWVAGVVTAAICIPLVVLIVWGIIDAQQYRHPHIFVRPQQVHAGSTLTIEGAGFAGGSVDVLVLGRVLTLKVHDRAFSGGMVVPVTAPAGEESLVVIYQGGSGYGERLEKTFVVTH